MAINDIKISNLPAIDTSNVTDDGVLVHTQGGANYKLSIAQIKTLTEFLLANEPALPDISDSTLLSALSTADGQGTITADDLATYVLGKAPALEKAQRGSMRLGTETTQTITDDALPVKATAFDTKVTATQQFEVTPGNYNIRYVGTANIPSAIVSVGLNLEFPGTEEVEIYFYINDSAYSSQPIHAQGRGTGKPVEIYWESDIQLAQNDVMDIRIRNADSGSFDLTYLRSTFRVDITPNLDI
jgi:hypothetical protein